MSHQMISNMANINAVYPISKLIEALEKYRDIHKEEYLEALSVYRDDVAEKVAELQTRWHDSRNVLNNFDVTYNLGLTAPINCDREYVKLIRILEGMDKTDSLTIKLNLAEANRILNNDWDWIEAASTSNAFYTSRKKA